MNYVMASEVLERRNGLVYANSLYTVSANQLYWIMSYFVTRSTLNSSEDFRPKSLQEGSYQNDLIGKLFF